ncbi:TPR repeat-containing protein [Salegentibacter holothuriorum]|uniref:TPR repeat-containing protein n=1 Tax=Salegentibacter holothuriorum TaxID=241145 RepID=A0A1T5AKB8_9FLAO|nr:tetratricopeptide repeat protein [Salegentibacter holothuriorum]SKB35227.1 TPR repeat-containing protein [Salegentibacter holothuriorum]
MVKKIITLISILIIGFSCNRNDKSVETSTKRIDNEKQEEIIDKYLKNGAWKYQVYSQEWQDEIDKGLEKDSTIAYLWQQKAMPLIKQGKYEIGIDYIDNAVKYDRKKWQDYRAFTKCIFAKTYKDAIKDFEDYKKRFGYGYVMDHTYDFYIGLSHLQLNEFEKAEKIFQEDYQYQLKENGKEWLHPLDLFYFGISKYELRKYEEAIKIFDLALELYPQFSDVQVYKAVCLRKLGKPEEAKIYDKLAEKNGRNGYTINEDNAIYERYPYQMR